MFCIGLFLFLGVFVLKCISLVDVSIDGKLNLKGKYVKGEGNQCFYRRGAFEL